MLNFIAFIAPFVIHHEKESGILILGTRENLMRLAYAQEWYMEWHVQGTLKSKFYLLHLSEKLQGNYISIFIY